MRACCWHLELVSRCASEHSSSSSMTPAKSGRNAIPANHPDHDVLSVARKRRTGPGQIKASQKKPTTAILPLCLASWPPSPLAARPRQVASVSRRGFGGSFGRVLDDDGILEPESEIPALHPSLSPGRLAFAFASVFGDIWMRIGSDSPWPVNRPHLGEPASVALGLRGPAPLARGRERRGAARSVSWGGGAITELCRCPEPRVVSEPVARTIMNRRHLLAVCCGTIARFGIGVHPMSHREPLDGWRWPVNNRPQRGCDIFADQACPGRRHPCSPSRQPA